MRSPQDSPCKVNTSSVAANPYRRVESFSKLVGFTILFLEQNLFLIKFLVKKVF